MISDERWYIGKILRDLRSPTLVFILILNAMVLLFIYWGVAERRRLDAEVIKQLLGECAKRTELINNWE